MTTPQGHKQTLTWQAVVLALAIMAFALPRHVQANDFSIVNGTVANASNYPWFVTVYSNGYQCDGSLIHPLWVMTAAHCFSPGQGPGTVSIVAGRQLLSNSASGQEISAKRIVVNASYNSTTEDNDIALIELNSPVYGQYVKLLPPIQALTPGQKTKAIGRGALAAPADYLSDKLSLRSDCRNDLLACILEAEQKGTTDPAIISTLLQANGLGDPSKGIGYSQLVSLLPTSAATAPSVNDLISGLSAEGFSVADIATVIVNAAGTTDEVREVDLPVVDNAVCQTSLGSSVTGNMLCSGYQGTPKDTCQGDSGGPLVIRNPQNTDWLQVGIVSWGATCGTNYGVNTKVANYLDWIGQYVPTLAAERVFMWGESVGAPSILKAAGNEHSSTAYANYWSRVYPASGTALLLGSSDQNLYFYDGKNLSSLGSISSWLAQAKAAGY
ncbi:MAG: serine protease [Sulfuricellaceae bacterium]|nr:serine protease [Sulfuricellaceae bacterium]